MPKRSATVTPINRARGEMSIIAAGMTYRLALTLGALAEMESHLQADGFADLQARMGNLKVADIIVLITIMARAGGNPMTPAIAESIDIQEAMRMLSAMTPGEAQAG